MRKVLFCLLSLAVAFSTSLAAQAADFPNGYLVYSTYVGGKLETVPFESIEINNQYNGSIKNAAGRSITYSTKLAVAVVILDAATFEGMPAKLGGANSTFIASKIYFADLSSGKSDVDDLLAQKTALDKLMAAQKLNGPLKKVSEELDAVLARAQEAAKNAPAPTANVSPRDTVFSFTTVSGEQHLNVRVTNVSESGVNLAMENGLSRVPLDQIPDNASKFPEPWRLEIAKVREGIAQRIADEKKRIADEAAKKAEEEAAKKAAEEAEKAAKANPPAAAAKPTTPPDAVVDVKATGTPAAAPKK